MSEPLSGLSSSTQLVDLYDQASKKGLLDKRPEALFLKMDKEKLALEGRGFLSWLKRVVVGRLLFIRGDKEYNFFENLTKFQRLIEGSLGELHTQNIDSENVEKIEKVISIYNNLLLSKKEKSPTTRFDQYMKKVGIQITRETPQEFSPLRVINKIPEAQQDPVFNFIRANLTASKEALPCALQLLLQRSPQLQSISDAYKKLQDRVEALNLFHLGDPRFLNAQAVLSGTMQKGEKPQIVNVDTMISHLNGVKDSLAPIVKEVFEKEEKEITELKLKFTAFQKDIDEQNTLATKVGYLEVLPSVQNAVNPANELLQKHDEGQLRDIVGKIAQLKKETSEVEEKLKGFKEGLKKTLGKSILAKWEHVKDFKSKGPTAAKVADAWISSFRETIHALQTEGLQAKDKAIKVLQDKSDEQFEIMVMAELEKQQLEVEQAIQPLLISYKPEGLIGAVIGATIGAVFRKIGGEDPAVTKARADYSYGITKLKVEVDKALTWNKLLSKMTKNKGPQDEGAIQKKMSVLQGELKEKKTLPHEKIIELFEGYKKVGEMNIALQTALETKGTAIANLDVMQRIFALLTSLQEEVDVLKPLTEGADPAYSAAYDGLEGYCTKLWEEILQRPLEGANGLKAELERKKTLLDTLVPSLWTTWQRDNPEKATKKIEDFMKKSTQLKNQDMATII